MASLNIEDGACLDISTNGFWGGWCEKTYIDAKVFNPHAPSNRSTNAKSIYRKHELSKKRSYEARILEIERSSFTPSIFSATGGMANEATFFLQESGFLTFNLQPSDLRLNAYRSLFLLFVMYIYISYSTYALKKCVSHYQHYSEH